MANNAIVIVENAKTHQDTAKTVAQPLCLVMLVRPNLVENKRERVRGGEKVGNSLRAAGNPGAEQLEQAKSTERKKCILAIVLL